MVADRAECDELFPKNEKHKTKTTCPTHRGGQSATGLVLPYRQVYLQQDLKGKHTSEDIICIA